MFTNKHVCQLWAEFIPTTRATAAEPSSVGQRNGAQKRGRHAFCAPVCAVLVRLPFQFHFLMRKDAAATQQWSSSAKGRKLDRGRVLELVSAFPSPTLRTSPSPRTTAKLTKQTSP